MSVKRVVGCALLVALYTCAATASSTIQVSVTKSHDCDTRPDGRARLVDCNSRKNRPSGVVDRVLGSLRQRRPATRASLLEFLRFESVSADPERQGDVRNTAEWLAKYLETMGLENVKLIPTEHGPPVVYADWLHAKTGCMRVDHGASDDDDSNLTNNACSVLDGGALPTIPTVLIYGHYDVQPEDPVEMWTTPPFEPSIRNGRVYARGASDDKAHLMVPIHAAAAWLNATSSLPVNLKFLFEGEEEIGSPSLPALLRERRNIFHADYVLSADGGQVSPEQPGLCLGLRGAVAVQVDVHGSEIDAHSGTAGGGVPNPLHVLSDIVASLHDADGRIAVSGMYDDVIDLSDEDRRDIKDFIRAKPEADALAGLGASRSTGEKGYNFYERTWARPAIDVVGMWGGYHGDGLKAVLPQSAHAKLSARLVAAQEPDVIVNKLTNHIKAVGGVNSGVRVEVTQLPFVASPVLMSKQSVGSRAAASVLSQVYGRQPVYFRMGGSIPVFGLFKEHLGLEPIMFAFGHADENVHAPDEFARLDSLDRGEEAYVRVFRALAREHAKQTYSASDRVPVSHAHTLVSEEL